MIRERRKLHSEELHRFFAVHLILDRMVKSRRLRWVGHLARMEEGRRAFKTLTDTPTGKRPLARQKDLNKIMKIILEWILKK